MAMMFELDNIERALLKTRKSLRQVCEELDIDVPNDLDLLTIDTCSSCGTWHRQYKLIEDLDGNYICSYCAELIGL